MESFLITEKEYENLPMETARKYRYCPKCDGFYNSHRLIKCICHMDGNEGILKNPGEKEK